MSSLSIAFYIACYSCPLFIFKSCFYLSASLWTFWSVLSATLVSLYRRIHSPKLRLFPVAFAYCNHSFLNRRLRRSNHQGRQQRNIWMIKRSIAPKEKRSCAKAGIPLSVKNLTDRFLHVMKVGTIKLLSARCFVILIISLLDDWFLSMLQATLSHWAHFVVLVLCSMTSAHLLKNLSYGYDLSWMLDLWIS